MITSTANNRIRELVKIKKSAKVRAQRDVFLVEGPKMFREIPADLLLEVYVSESCQKSAEGRALLSKTGVDPDGSSCPGQVRAETVSDAVFAYLSDTRTPQGILAVVRQQHYTLKDLIEQVPVTRPEQVPATRSNTSPALVIVLENIQDPGNLGTILRTAEAAGATGILLSEGCADLYNPKVTRSTMGSIFRMPFFYTSHLHRELRSLQSAGVKLYAAHLKGSTDLYTQAFTDPCAFLIGNESRGLTEETAALADQAVRIPMSGQVESLNAAVAASVLMYEAKRQRMLR